ncbi:hypothetical protein BJX99DRAFT_218697 [Aspergillus californicus]
MSSIISTTFSSLPSLRDIVLPTPTVYATLLNIFQYFPFVTLIQWLTPWHPAGKTSYKDSPFNIPGRLAWFIMEIVGPLNLVYILSNLPQRFNIQTLPLPNKLVASLYVLHYVNRAIISPFFAAPSMSPIHIFVMVSAIFFNWFNSTCLAGWIVGYTVDIRYPRALSLAKGSHSSLDDALTAPEKVLDDSLSNKSCATLVLPGIGLALFIIGMRQINRRIKTRQLCLTPKKNRIKNQTSTTKSTSSHQEVASSDQSSTHTTYSNGSNGQASRFSGPSSSLVSRRPRSSLRLSSLMYWE